MKKLLTLLLLVISLCLVFPKTSFAIVDPLAVPNNKFGIHIIDENDLEDASKLVNSSGGDYGYITLVIREDEKDTIKWQNVLDKARRLHLIPIVRIAGKQTDKGWSKLNKDEIDGWATFLNSLNWVTLNRYIVVGNEPNHAGEWGGELKPEEYTDYLLQFTERLKSLSNDFFIISAGFDASAPNNGEHMSEETYIRKMVEYKKDVFEKIDGWSSHSYPNPGFSGAVSDRGRISLHTYEWEEELLEKLGVTKKLPIFITETGWAHSVSDRETSYLSPDIVNERYVDSFQNNWRDSRIVAITPFVLNYTHPPFDVFSWKKKDGTFYDFYSKVQEIKKVKGEPVRIVGAEIISFLFPAIIQNEGNKYGLTYVKNTGQTIWVKNDKINVSTETKIQYLLPIIFQGDVAPGHNTLATYELESE